MFLALLAAMHSLASMLADNTHCFRAWQRLHPLHLMASANLFRYLSSPQGWRSGISHAAVERLVAQIAKVPVAKKFAGVQADAMAAAEVLLKRSSASTGVSWSVWIGAAALLLVGGSGLFAVLRQ